LGREQGQEEIGKKKRSKSRGRRRWERRGGPRTGVGGDGEEEEEQEQGAEGRASEPHRCLSLMAREVRERLLAMGR
jgi:hypothetical protein